MTKKIKKIIKRVVVNQPVVEQPKELTPEEKQRFNTEKLYATAFCHQLGELMSKQVKKLNKQFKGQPEEILKDPYVRFVNDLQLIIIQSYGLVADEIINCDLTLLPPKMKKLNITADEKEGCKTCMQNMLVSGGIMESLLGQLDTNSDEAKYLVHLSKSLQTSANWLSSVFGVNPDEEPSEVLPEADAD